MTTLAMEKGMQIDKGLQNARDAMHWLHSQLHHLEKTKAYQHNLLTSTIFDCQANDSKSKVLCIHLRGHVAVDMLKQSSALTTT